MDAISPVDEGLAAKFSGYAPGPFGHAGLLGQSCFPAAGPVPVTDPCQRRSTRARWGTMDP